MPVWGHTKQRGGLGQESQPGRHCGNSLEFMPSEGRGYRMHTALPFAPDLAGTVCRTEGRLMTLLCRSCSVTVLINLRSGCVVLQGPAKPSLRIHTV